MGAIPPPLILDEIEAHHLPLKMTFYYCLPFPIFRPSYGSKEEMVGQEIKLGYLARAKARGS